MNDSQKAPYTPPLVQKVRLIQEEALLSNCKSASGSNRSSGRCQTASNCSNSQVGS